MPLRPYQKQGIDAIRAGFQAGHQGQIYQLMTGGGKTFTGLTMAVSCLAAGLRVLILVHRIELIDQWYDDATGLFARPCGVLSASWRRRSTTPYSPLQIAGVDTLASRLKKSDPFPNGFDLIIVDECHLAASNRYLAVLDHYDTLVLGLSATPERLDGRGFRWASNLVEGPSYPVLQDYDALVPFTTYSPDVLDVSDLKVKFGEFTRKSQKVQYESQKLIGKDVEHYFRYAEGRSCITFKVSVKAAKESAEIFNSYGVESRVIHGQMDPKLRKEYVEATRAGEIVNLINVDCLTEGLNIPRVKAVLCDFATLSVVRWRQAAGRSLRPCPESGFDDAVIIDTGGNAIRLGNLDYDYQWNIHAREKRRGKPTDVVAAKRCPKCAGINPASARQCFVCGDDLTPQPKGPKRKAGQLHAVAAGAAPTSKKSKRVLSKDKADEMREWAWSLQ